MKAREHRMSYNFNALFTATKLTAILSPVFAFVVGDATVQGWSVPILRPHIDTLLTIIGTSQLIRPSVLHRFRRWVLACMIIPRPQA